MIAPSETNNNAYAYTTRKLPIPFSTTGYKILANRYYNHHPLTQGVFSFQRETKDTLKISLSAFTTELDKTDEYQFICIGY